MALNVKVKIEVSKPIGSAGFGIPLLLQAGYDEDNGRIEYTECYSLDDVKAAGFDEDSPMYAAATKLFMQEHRPAKIAVFRSEIESGWEAVESVLSKDWRQLIMVDTTWIDESLIEYIETTNKMLYISKTKAEFATYKKTLSGKKYDRLVIFVNSDPYANAALVGETAGRTAGSFTYAFKTLKGIAAETFTDAELAELHEAGAFAYVTKCGDDVTSEGITQSGEYIDHIDSIDYVLQDITYRTQKVFHNNAKVSFDDRGIALLEVATTAALQAAFANGIIATKEDGVTPDYTVTFGARSATTEAERASRVYKYGTFRFSLAGAIHDCEVFGEVTY